MTATLIDDGNGAAPTADEIAFAEVIVDAHAGNLFGRCSTCGAWLPCRLKVFYRRILDAAGVLPGWERRPA